MEIRNYLAKQITKYPNVKLHDFQWDNSITCNFENYKDITHYSKDINTLMLKSIASNTHQQTGDVTQMQISNRKITQDVQKFKMSYMKLRKPQKSIP